MLASGLRGIEEKYELPASLDKSPNLADHIKLPTQLQEALFHFEKSEFMKEVLGPFTHGKFLENKYHELDKYNRFITDYEIEEYLPIL
jgi:glutamine synthetase